MRLKFRNNLRDVEVESENFRIFISNGSTLPSLSEIIANFSTNSTKSNTSCGIFIGYEGNINGRISHGVATCAFKEMLRKLFVRKILEFQKIEYELWGKRQRLWLIIIISMSCDILQKQIRHYTFRTWKFIKNWFRSTLWDHVTFSRSLIIFSG